MEPFAKYYNRLVESVFAPVDHSSSRFRHFAGVENWSRAVSRRIIPDMEWMLDRGFDDIGMILDGYDKSALLWAIWNGDMMMVKFLLDRGADPLVPGSSVGKNAFELAFIAHYDERLIDAYEYKKIVDMLKRAAEEGC